MEALLEVRIGLNPCYNNRSLNYVRQKQFMFTLFTSSNSYALAAPNVKELQAWTTKIRSHTVNIMMILYLSLSLSWIARSEFLSLIYGTEILLLINTTLLFPPVVTHRHLLLHFPLPLAHQSPCFVVFYVVYLYLITTQQHLPACNHIDCHACIDRRLSTEQLRFTEYIYIRYSNTK